MNKEIFVGNAEIKTTKIINITGEYLPIQGDVFYKIHNFDQMPPFFMSLVSNSDHWMFISSSGGLSAGRSNSESALFPYYTDDKITENHTNTGTIDIFLINDGQKIFLWEPFSDRYAGIYQIERNLYKNVIGNQLIFEEINLDLQLSFRNIWRTSEKYGFTKTSQINNLNNTNCVVNILDGFQNILPYGATTALQNTFSNLLNAYKRAELEPKTGIGIFSLSSTLTDHAEASESLKATIVWQLGLENPRYLLSTRHIENFRCTGQISPEVDIRGGRGAYLVNASFELPAGGEKEWVIIADVNQDGGNISDLCFQLEQNPTGLAADLKHDIGYGNQELRRIVASADGLQLSNETLGTSHHFANVLFNCMRGGIFAQNYLIDRHDFLDFIQTRHQSIPTQFPDFFSTLPDQINYLELINNLTLSKETTDLRRLCYEYLPLTFSRRHGDPSRPWNKFSINLKNSDGTRRLDYQGNWRDIFQNWEPLAWSFPEYIEGMICKFLNATTADGYNPYRVTRDGLEWESPSPSDPWANIGYWGDHQIVYLESLLEISHKVHPERLAEMLDQRFFSHSHVPYKIKPYQAMLEDPFSTILFDWEVEEQVKKRVTAMGTDGRLVFNRDGQVFHVTLFEKLLSLLLAKLANFVPDGGIWMNTQRPEWNDANNALVGKGLSVVTLGYLRRFIVFLQQILTETPGQNFHVTCEIAVLLKDIDRTLNDYANDMRTSKTFEPARRKNIMDALGQAGSTFRTNYYENGFSGEFIPLQKDDVRLFLNIALEYIQHSLTANRRPDNLFHAYNIIQIKPGLVSIGHLDEMLEGQVSILASGLLSCTEAVSVLKSLRESRLFRPDQHSYILYPDRDLPGFIRKNSIAKKKIQDSQLITALIENGNDSLITRDQQGDFHFNGNFRNAGDVKTALAKLNKSEFYRPLVEAETGLILNLFEDLFKHNAFTGRSGTFFAYEGLGSIYWHMVSKLLLAVQENYWHALDTQAEPETIQALLTSYYDIQAGLGYNKSPEVYGAFPTDPYSHTPAGQGAKQPGMTGQVKEEILTRLRELGLYVNHGQIAFNTSLIQTSELLSHPQKFSYLDTSGVQNEIDLNPGSYAFTFCQVPVVVIMQADEKEMLRIDFSNHQNTMSEGNILDTELSHHIFKRTNHVKQLTFFTRMR